VFLITRIGLSLHFNIKCLLWVFILNNNCSLIFSVFSCFDPYNFEVGPIIIISKFTYEQWKLEYNNSMTKEGHNLLKTRLMRHALDITKDIVLKYK